MNRQQNHLKPYWLFFLSKTGSITRISIEKWRDSKNRKRNYNFFLDIHYFTFLHISNIQQFCSKIKLVNYLFNFLTIVNAVKERFVSNKMHALCIKLHLTQRCAGIGFFKIHPSINYSASTFDISLAQRRISECIIIN